MFLFVICNWVSKNMNLSRVLSIIFGDGGEEPEKLLQYFPQNLKVFGLFNLLYCYQLRFRRI